MSSDSSACANLPPDWETRVAELERAEAVRLDRELLRRYRFDTARFAELREKARALAAPEALAPANLLPLEPGDVERLPEDPAARRALEAEGEAMLRAGEVAVLVWAGGMATRFGGVVKACVEAVDGMSFLGAKARDVCEISRRLGAEVPFCVMTSFATDEGIRAELARERNYGLTEGRLLLFAQSLLLRLTPEGGLFRDAQGEVSPYAPGHGDFFAALRRSGVLGELRRRGVRWLFASNVDNLGALVDPKLLALSRRSGRAMVAEVTRARPGEKGASAVRVRTGEGRSEVRLVEYVRLPAGTALADALLNTNSLYFDVAAIDREIPLPFFPVHKKLDGREALQLEQITCEVCAVRDPKDAGQALLPLGLIEVVRDGPGGRFYPVKEPADLEAVRPQLQARLREAWSR